MYPQRYHPGAASVNDAPATKAGSSVEAATLDRAPGVLGNDGVFTSTPATKRDVASVERYRVRENVLWDYSVLRPVRACGRCRIKQKDEAGNMALASVSAVRTVRADGRVSASFRGFQTCASPWACPICAVKIREGKARELGSLVVAHEAAGGGVVDLLLTSKHTAEWSLSEALGRFKRAVSKFANGRPWRTFCDRWGVKGYAYAPDFMHGVNGWHVHAHGVWLLARPLDEAERQAFGNEWFALWRAACGKVGLGTPLQRFNQTREVLSGHALATYAVKAMREVTRTDAKHRFGASGEASPGGLSPWDLLYRFEATGDLDALALWNEYELATKRKHSLSLSDGARALLGTYGVREASEQELAAGKEDGTVEDVLNLAPDDVATLHAVPGRSGWLLAFMRNGGSVLALDALVHWRLADEARNRRESRAGPPRGRSPARSG